MVIELQVISYILTNHNGKNFIENNNVCDEWFHGYNDEFRYIKEHLIKYKKLPDVLTFLKNFEDFEVEQVAETEAYLLTELLDNHRYTILAERVQSIATLIAESPIKAQKLIEELAIDLKAIDFYKMEATNLFSNEFTDKARKAFQKRKELNGLCGISTGIKELDDVTYGWQDSEELAVILGRPNEGKSWLLLYFLVNAFMNGHNVLMYSGEMSKLAIFARIVTFIKHIGNKEIMVGDAKVEDAYMDFIELTKDYKNEFVVIEPEDIGGGKLTTDKLELFIKKHNPDIVGLDQLSLMEDYRRRKGDNRKDKYNHITQDLFLMSSEYKVPILLAVQANRNGSMQGHKQSKQPPELHQIADADEIAQNASKVLSIKNNTRIELEMDKPNLYIKIAKNRFGEKDVILGFTWEINEGKIERKTLINTATSSIEEEEDGGEQPF